MFFTHNATCEQVAKACKVCEAPHTRLAGARLEWRLMQRERVRVILTDDSLGESQRIADALTELSDNPY